MPQERHKEEINIVRFSQIYYASYCPPGNYPGDFYFSYGNTGSPSGLVLGDTSVPYQYGHLQTIYATQLAKFLNECLKRLLVIDPRKFSKEIKEGLYSIMRPTLGGAMNYHHGLSVCGVHVTPLGEYFLWSVGTNSVEYHDMQGNGKYFINPNSRFLSPVQPTGFWGRICETIVRAEPGSGNVTAKVLSLPPPQSGDWCTLITDDVGGWEFNEGELMINPADPRKEATVVIAQF